MHTGICMTLETAICFEKKESSYINEQYDSILFINTAIIIFFTSFVCVWKLT